MSDSSSILRFTKQERHEDPEPNQRLRRNGPRMMNESQAAFLSYSREDIDFAVKLSKDLKNAGAIIWFDQTDIVPGTRWDLAV